MSLHGKGLPIKSAVITSNGPRQLKDLGFALILLQAVPQPEQRSPQTSAIGRIVTTSRWMTRNCRRLRGRTGENVRTIVKLTAHSGCQTQFQLVKVLEGAGKTGGAVCFGHDLGTVSEPERPFALVGAVRETFRTTTHMEKTSHHEARIRTADGYSSAGTMQVAVIGFLCVRDARLFR